MPINAYFRQTCRDPHYDSANTGIPVTHMTLSFECRAEAPTSTPTPVPTCVPNKAQQAVLRTMHQIALEYYDKPMHSITYRLSSMLYNYIQQTGLGKTQSISPSERSLTPPPPTMTDRSTCTPSTWTPQQKAYYTTKRTPTPRTTPGPSTSIGQGKRRHESPHRHRQEKHPSYWRRDNH